MLWTQEPDGCVHPVDEGRLFDESPVFHQLMNDRQLDCLSGELSSTATYSPRPARSNPMSQTTPAAEPRLRTPNVLRSHDPEMGTHSHMYLTTDQPKAQEIIAYFVRTPRLMQATVYLHTPGKGANIRVYEGVTEQEAVTQLQNHLEAQGYSMAAHPLSD